MIRIASKEICDKVKSLVKPKCKSTPLLIYIYSNSIAILWPNKTAYISNNIYYGDINIVDDEIEICILHKSKGMLGTILIPTCYK